MRRFVLCLTLCHFVLVFFSPFSIAITSLGEERAIHSAFRTFVRFVLVWICRFPLPLGVWERLRFVIVILPGLFSYLLSHFTLQQTILIPGMTLADSSIHMSNPVRVDRMGLHRQMGRPNTKGIVAQVATFEFSYIQGLWKYHKTNPMNIKLFISVNGHLKLIAPYRFLVGSLSRKHAYIILTPLNPTFLQ